MASMVYPVMPAPGLGLELRRDPLGNTFLNWPAVEDEVPALRPRSRSCPGHISIHHTASTTSKLRQAAGLDNITQDSKTPGPDLAFGKERSFNKKVRPLKLKLVPEELDMHHLGEASDDAGCCTASTWCSGGWSTCKGDSGGERDVDNSHTGLDATFDSHVSKPDVVATAKLVESEGQWSAAELTSTTRGDAGPGDQKYEAGGGFTTLMIQRLPSNISQARLATALNLGGFQDAYDFLYMPSVFDTSQVRKAGYAFVNLTEPSTAQRLLEAWNKGRPFGKLQTKGLHISVADIQGREANISKWNNSKMKRIRDPNHRPIVLGKNWAARPTRHN